MRRFLKTAIKIVLAIVVLALILIAGVIVAVNISPKPFAWFVHRQFSGGIGVAPVTPAIYQELSPTVRSEKDIEYPSKYKDNRIDVFSPKDASGPLPTILFPHGGGFVGGDKAGLETWATMIAGKGYTIVTINYELAPETHYPTPLIQVSEVYDFLKRNPQRFPAADLRRLIIGGDSAGAQIASQFAALQTNPELAKSMQLNAVVPKEDLNAAILYCGPYDFVGLHDSESWFSRFFVRQIGWAYFGVRDWRDTPQAAQASTVQNVTRDYPATFITDGNSGSFEPDARKLEAKLRENGVYVDSLYYPVEHGKLGHEYQFDFALPESVEVYNRTLAFLEKATAGK